MRFRSLLRAGLMAGGLWSAGVLPAAARMPPPPPRDQDVCQAAIRSVMPSTALPAPLLGAIGRVESGRPDPLDGAVKPWPWTINAEGQGTLFDHREDAIAAVLRLQARGVVSIDVGCMQVNLAYHPTAFATLDDAFDPVTNVRYAARFLTALHAQLGDWDSAAAAYHSRTPDIAEAYRLKVVAAMGGASLPAAAPKPPVRNDLALAWAATVSPAQSFGTVPLGGGWSANPGRTAPARPTRTPSRPALALVTTR